jgi:tRNA 2-thiouridine synthesizing protein E
MAELEIEGRVFEVDGDGFMQQPELWDEEVAKLIAKSDGIDEMNEKHWAIVRVIRKHYEEKGMAPMVRVLCKDAGVKLRELYELFPLGPARGACRVAGLPKPDGCV